MGVIIQSSAVPLSSVERIEAVADKVAGFRREGLDVVVVVSAMSGETNRLIGLAREIHDDPAPRGWTRWCLPESR